MKKHLVTFRRILCLLLCVSLLPLVKVSAAGYNDAFQALAKWAKKGEYYQETYDEVGTVRFSSRDMSLGGYNFQITYQDPVDTGYPDYVVVSIYRFDSGESWWGTDMVLSQKDRSYIEFNRNSSSERRDGKPDAYGNYYGMAYAELVSGETLENGLNMYDYDAAVSRSRILSDLKKDAGKVLEFADLILRQSGLMQGVQMISSKITPQSIHSFGHSWIDEPETCTQDGIMGFECSFCGARYFEPIKAGHIWNLTETYTPATEEHGSGLFTCERCGETKKDELCVSSAFGDMPAKDNWAHPGIDWAVYNGITNGTSATSFSPGQGCTRGQVVTFLWRTAGKPEPLTTVTPFTDVAAGAFYDKAVAWAVENGITNGLTPTTFAPDSKCNRGQIVTFLWRFMGCPEPGSISTPFNDVESGAFYEKAVAWAVENGITAGTSRTAFSPLDVCTRAQVVTFLYRTQKGSGEPVVYKDLVGISMPTNLLVRWSKDGELMKSLLTEAGCEVSLVFGANNPNTQISQISKMIRDGAKVIIVSAIDAEALRSILSSARKAGIKVIAYDRPLMDPEAVDYIATFDNFAVGAAQGRFIAERLDLDNAGNRSYNIEIIGGDPGDPNGYVFYDGAMSVLRPYIENGNLNVISGAVEYEDVATPGWASELAQTRFEQLLRNFYFDRPLHAVMASNDSTAYGVIAALEQEYSNDIYPVITGQDCDIVAVRNMIAGKQAMSVIKETGKLVGATVGLVEAVLKGSEPETQPAYFNGSETVAIKTVLCPPTVCTVDNIRELLIDSGYYTEEEIYGN